MGKNPIERKKTKGTTLSAFNNKSKKLKKKIPSIIISKFFKKYYASKWHQKTKTVIIFF
jgi:hypothetical protein